MFCALFINLQLICTNYKNLKPSLLKAGFLAWLLCVTVSEANLLVNYQEQYRPRQPPINQNHQLDQRVPSEVMVDLSNDLSFKILYLHSILNRNNFAFSPTALMCVLVALYEGSAGLSSVEMRNCLPMPYSRDVIRVGYRDIHRRLRTYFFDDENPLKGLSLNKENVTITAEFETILKFYGYDLGMDMISSSTNKPSTATPEESTLSTTPAPTSSTTEKPTTPIEESTATLITRSSAPTEISMNPEITTLEPETTIFFEVNQISPRSATLEPKSEEKPPTTTEEYGEFVTISNSRNVSKVGKANLKRLKSNGKLISQPRLEYLPAKYTPARGKVFKRYRRHLYGLKTLKPSLFLTFMQPKAQFLQSPPQSEIFAAKTYSATPQSQIDFQSFYSTGSTHSLEAYPILPIQNENGFLSHKDNLKSEVVDHIFYVNNQDVVHTTFKVYNSVLYYKYFEQFKISVLELELDSIEYNLLIILPDYGINLIEATANLRLGPTLKTLRKQLKPCWVQAIIPDFELHGAIFLTNDLQNLGVCNLFEPNRADLRPMTDESGIYVKHIEQNIDVNIRTRAINHLKRSYGPQTLPIQVSVNHPFMFFIIDRDLDVATMAGRILNPLNVRIQ